MRSSLFLLMMFLLTVCTQKVQANIIPILGAIPELILAGPTPGLAGINNTLSVSGATPNERVYFIYGFVPGSTAMPGCPGDSAGINSPRILGFSEADFEGNASYTAFVPGIANGRTILFQAVEIANCIVSNIVEYTFAPVSFERTYGDSSGEIGYSVQQTTDGGYIVTGYTASFGAGSNDVYLIKTDPSGDTLWTRTYGGSGADYGRSVQQTTDGGYIVAGYTGSFGAGSADVYLIKTDLDGIMEWSQTFGGSSPDRGYCVQQTSDGGYIVAGETSGPSEIGYLIKTDGDGNMEWSQTFNELYSGRSVQQTQDGGYTMVGSIYSGDCRQLRCMVLIKTDGDGNLEWSQAIGQGDISNGYSVQQTQDSGYIIAGETCYDHHDCQTDLYLVKTNENGFMQWSRTFGGSGDDVGRSVQQTTDGGYIVTGYTRSFGAGSNDVYLVKTDGNGFMQWSRRFGGSSTDRGYSVQQTTDGNYIVTGYTASFGAGLYDVYLIKTD